jgi:outer membrane protein assembly factor BamB
MERNVDRLPPKWTATTTGDVSGTPAVVDGAVYFGDFGGTVWKLDAETGEVIWSASVAGYTGHAGDYARTSPSLAGNTLVVDDDPLADRGSAARDGARLHQRRRLGSRAVDSRQRCGLREVYGQAAK